MAARIDFRILGPLEARVDERVVDVRGLRQRAVLAMLVLHADRVVSTGRLVDGVWGESPPTTVSTALQGHISHLRRELGKDVIVTRAPGYMLVTGGAGAVDASRCEDALERARRSLAAGDAAAATTSLERALGEWRGAPLADVADAPFAAAELPALEELEIALREELAEARLQQGRGAEVVVGLRALVAAHPLRERPRAQLMRALHLDGRDAEALGVYDEGRRVLAEELGMPPGEALRAVHGEILAARPEPGDATPTSGSPPGAAPTAGGHDTRPPRRRLRPAWLIAAATVALAGGAVAVAVVGSGHDTDPPVAPIAGAQLVRIDPGTLRVEQRVGAPGTPASVAALPGRAWFIDADRQTITEVRATGGRRTFATGASPTDLAAAGGSLWVSGGAVGSSQFQGPLTTRLDEILAGTAAVRANVELPRTAPTVSTVQNDRVAVSERAVWVIGRDGALVRVDPRSHEVVRVLRLQAVAVAPAGRDGVWVLTRDLSVVPVTERGSRVGAPIAPRTTVGGSIATGDGAVWLTDPAAGAVVRIDPATSEVRRGRVGAGLGALTFGAGAVWVLQPALGRVLRVDPRTLEVTGDVTVGGTPRDLSVTEDGVWVTVADARANVAAACGPLERGRGARPDLVVVADLPLRGDPGAPPPAMAAAILDAFRRRGFRAGRHDVGLRICDAATSQSGSFDAAKCLANARAYASAPEVVAEIGPYHSGCAEQQLKVAAHAPRGPLGVISPSNSAPMLTRETRAVDRGAYVRLAARDDRQAAALARLLARRGRRRPFVLDDGQGYGRDSASYFAAAARAAGMRIAGRATWRTDPVALARLAGRIRRSGADVVWVGGLLDTGAGAVVRALGGRVPAAGPESLLPVGGLFADAGNAARGTLVSTAFVPLHALPAAGRRRADELARARGGRAVHPSAVYAAEAADVVLDAIAASDGTRASVARGIRSTRARRGLLGRYRFDAAGDVRDAPVAVVRARRGGGARTSGSTEGADLVDVVRTAG